MEVHPKKKIEIFVETPVVKKVLALIDESGATGATFLPVLGGHSDGGDWSDKDLGSAMDMQKIMVVTGPRRAAIIRDTVYEAVADYRTMILISDVEVIRNDHF